MSNTNWNVTTVKASQNKGLHFSPKSAQMLEQAKKANTEGNGYLAGKFLRQVMVSVPDAKLVPEGVRYTHDGFICWTMCASLQAFGQLVNMVETGKIENLMTEATPTNLADAQN